MMRMWWNGRHDSFRSYWRKRRGGSTPLIRTKIFIAVLFAMILSLLLINNINKTQKTFAADDYLVAVSSGQSNSKTGSSRQTSGNSSTSSSNQASSGSGNTTVLGTSSTGSGALQSFVNALVNDMVGAVGTSVMGLLLLYAGFKYISSQGNKDAISDAKELMVSVVTGYVLLLTIGLIMRFLF